MSGMVVQIGADVRGAIRGIEDVSLSLKEQKAILASLQRQYAQLNTSQARGAIGKDLAADIRVAKDEINRLSAASTSGFGAVGTAGTKAFSAVRQFAYVLPGIGIAGIIGGLSNLVIGLFESGSGFSKAAIAAGHFSQAINDSKDAIDNLKDSLEFSGKLEKLKFELQGFAGINLTNAGTGVDIKNRITEISALDTEINKLTKSNKELVSTRLNVEKAISSVGGESKLAKLIKAYGTVNDLPKALVSEVSKQDQALVSQYQTTTDRIKELQKQRLGLERQNALDIVNIPLQIFKESQKKIPEIKELKVPVRKVKFTVSDVASFDFDTAVAANIKMPKRTKFDITGGSDRETGTDDFFERAVKQANALGNLVSGTLTPVFQQLFDTIAKGGNVFKAFGQAIVQALVQVITKLITTVALAAVLSAITGGIGGVGFQGASGFKQIFSSLLGFRATGGPVGGGNPYIVGERGPELFVPSTSGRIIPNNQSGSFAGGANPVVIFNGRLAVSGNELKLLLNRTDKYQGRNV